MKERSIADQMRYFVGMWEDGNIDGYTLMEKVSQLIKKYEEQRKEWEEEEK